MKNIYLIGNLPGWVIALAALAVGALLLQQFMSLKQRLAVGPTSFLVLLRTCVYSVLIFFLLGPALVENRVTKLRLPLTVLIDTSEAWDFRQVPKTRRRVKQGKRGSMSLRKNCWTARTL